MRNKLFRLSIGLLAITPVLLSGCVYEPLETDLSTRNIYPIANNTYQVGSATSQYLDGYFQNVYVNGVAVGGGGLEIDPVFTASDAFPITAAEIATWNAHPALTTGTHGVTGTIVGTSDAQSLTNKKLTMDNNEPIYWDDTLGTDVEVFNLWLDNNLHILDNGDANIFAWLGSGTGKTMYLWPTASTAIATTKNSPTIDFVANYWNAGNANWEAKIYHAMVTAGAAPKSRLGFLINDVAILRLENDNGTVKIYSDGTLDMTTHQINNVVDPTLAQDAATKNYVDSMTNYAGMYRHESGNVTAIQQVNDWHLVNQFTEGYTGGGWSYHDGEQMAITAYDNNGDGKTRVTCVGHLMGNGNVLSISGTTSYDGVWVVEQVAVNTFVINTPWVADDGASVGEHGGHFVSANVSSEGKYLVAYSLSVKPASANCIIEASIYCNATQEIKSESQTKLGAITDYQVVTGFSIVDVSVNDHIGLGIRNITDGGDFLIRDGNMTLVRLGA